MDVDTETSARWSAGLQRVALWVVIASVAAAALMGISALFVGVFGETQGRVLGTTFLILGGSLLIMATAPAVTRRWLRPLPELGIALAVAGFGLLTVMVWADAFDTNLIKVAATLVIWAVAIAHASLLSTARLKEGYGWILRSAYVSSALLAGAVTTIVVSAFSGDGEIWRFVGVVSITTASSSIAIPVFHRMSRLDETVVNAVDRAPGSPTFGFCPACGAAVNIHEPSGLIACPVCRVRSVVRLAEDESTPNPVEAQPDDSEPA